MSLESVRAFLTDHAPDLSIIESQTSTATVIEAAATHGVGPERIAKTLAFRVAAGPVLLVTRGDARLDNRKVKAAFGGRIKMLDRDEVEGLTGHPVGGVCPFGVTQNMPVFCDVSMQGFDVVIVAAGAVNASVLTTPGRIAALTDAAWVDVCKTADDAVALG